MKIHLNVPAANDIATQPTSAGQSATTQRTRTIDVDSFGSDTVSLSSLSAQTLQMPAVRQDKVNALRDQVEGGTYAIDPRATASAMLDEK
jgi:flagellar biosynthesis anti-sigma factor FlgM